MKRKSIILMMTAVLISATSCDKNFEDINDDPYAILEVTPDLLLPTVIRGSVNQMVNEGWSIGNIVVQHTAKIQFVNEDRYIWGDRTGIWNTLYGNLRDVYNLRALSETAGFNNYKGVALVMKSWIFSVLTDTYGDVPYSEAIRGKTEDIHQPTYDSQEQVYAGILADLNTANELLGSSDEAINGDILFGGDVMAWRKLANSLQLRYLMRISDKRDVAADFNRVLNDPVQFPVFESNADNATLAYLPEAP